VLVVMIAATDVVALDDREYREAQLAAWLVDEFVLVDRRRLEGWPPAMMGSCA
jgi:hypothetical protein